MLYLIKLDNAYKIGFSEDIEFRVKQIFKTHVDCKLLSTKFGNKKDEKELHKLCENYLIKNELFQPVLEVENIFNTYIARHLKESIDSISVRIKNLEEIARQYKELQEELEQDRQEIEKIIDQIRNRDESHK